MVIKVYLLQELHEDVQVRDQRARTRPLLTIAWFPFFFKLYLYIDLLNKWPATSNADGSPRKTKTMKVMKH